MEKALTFNTVKFATVSRNNQPWVRGIQIGYALDYRNPAQAISKLYDTHADEFTDEMTAVIKLPTVGGEQDVRIFSLRGCHLLAMFARTPVAKKFRRWVLDVLDELEKEQRPVPPSPDELPGGRSTDREMLPFNRLVNEWSRRSGVSRLEILAAIRRQFSLRHANRIPRAILPAVMDYVRQASGLSAPTSDRAKTFRELMNEIRSLAKDVGATLNKVTLTANPGGRDVILPPELESRYNAIEQMHKLAVAGLYQAEHTLYCLYFLGEGVDFRRA